MAEMTLKDAVKVLGLEQNDDQSQITKKYHNLALQNHLDRGGEEKKMQELNDAIGFIREKNFDIKAAFDIDKSNMQVVAASSQTAAPSPKADVPTTDAAAQSELENKGNPAPKARPKAGVFAPKPQANPEPKPEANKSDRTELDGLTDELDRYKKELAQGEKLKHHLDEVSRIQGEYWVGMIAAVVGAVSEVRGDADKMTDLRRKIEDLREQINAKNNKDEKRDEILSRLSETLNKIEEKLDKNQAPIQAADPTPSNIMPLDAQGGAKPPDDLPPVGSNFSPDSAPDNTAKSTKTAEATADTKQEQDQPIDSTQESSKKRFDN